MEGGGGVVGCLAGFVEDVSVCFLQRGRVIAKTDGRGEKVVEDFGVKVVDLFPD